jgi:excisionase family DNA binding protein
MPSDALAVLDAIPRDRLPDALGRVLARLLAPPAEPGADDELLTPDEAARLLKTDKRFLYRNAERLGVVRLGPRKLRFRKRAVLRRAGAGK